MTMHARLASLHRTAGSLWGVLLFVILFSGTWAAAQPSLLAWWRLPAPLSEPQAVPAFSAASGTTADAALPLDTLWQRAQAHGLILPPQTDLRWMLPDVAGGEPLTRFCTQQLCSLTLDARTGQPLANAHPGEALTTLHRSFFAGFPGRLAVSLFGIWMLILIVCGLWLQAPQWRQSLRLRRERGARVWHGDLHALLGLWTVPWLMVFAFTGALSGLGALGTLALAPVVHPDQPRQIMQDLMGPPPPAAQHRPWRAPPALDALLQADALAHPGFRATVLTLHHAGDAGASIDIGGEQRGVLSMPVFEHRLYDAATGSLLRSSSMASQGFWLQAFIAVQPVHTASYSGLPGANLWRVLHWLTALGACVLVATGLHLWMLRRSGSSLARLAGGICSGLVLSAGMTLLIGQAWPLMGHPATGWLSTPGVLACMWLACGLLPSLLPRRWPVGAGTLAVCGLLPLASALVHLLRVGMASGAPAPWWPDLVLMALGLCVMHHARRLWRMAPPATHALTGPRQRT